MTLLKRQNILKVADDHPLAIPHIRSLGNFPNDKAAATWARKRRRQGLLKLAGFVRNELGGRPLDLYFNGWTLKSDNTRHEKIGTDFALVHLAHATIIRGWNVPYRADLQMTIDDVNYFVEIDGATMPRGKVRRRWAEYKNCDNPILVVTAANIARGIDANERRDELMRWSSEIAPLALFATIDEILTNRPFDRFWKRIDDAELRRISPPASCETSIEGHLPATE